MRVSVVVPVADDGACLARVIEEIYAVAPPALLGEVIVVDDASTDNSPSVMRRLISDSSLRGLRYLRHKARTGRAFAIHTGAAAARFPFVVTFEGNGRSDPADIERLAHRIAPADEAPMGLICGVRTSRRDGWLGANLSAAANWTRRLFTRDACRDAGCGIRAMDRQAYLRLPLFRRQDLYLPALFASAGLRVAELAVNDRQAMAGASRKHVLRDAAAVIPDLAVVLWLTRTKPAELTEIWPDGGVEADPITKEPAPVP